MPLPPFKILAPVTAFALSGLFALPAYSGLGGGDETGGYSEPGGESFTGPEAGPAGNPSTTATVVTALRSTTTFCKLLPSSAYAVDCLAERMAELEQQLKAQAEFDEVRAVLGSTAKKLNDIARKNRSSSLSPARFKAQGQTPITTTRRLIPVDEAKLDAAASEAIAVINEAQTLLLRSAAGQSGDRAIQYQRIAAAIGSNKVLLRSV